METALLMTVGWRSTCSFFFFNDTATTEIYTLSLHDALPICAGCIAPTTRRASGRRCTRCAERGSRTSPSRSEEHTSELQSPCNLVCRLLLEKKKDARSTRTPRAPDADRTGWRAGSPR